MSAVKPGKRYSGSSNEPEPVAVHRYDRERAEQLLIEATLRHTVGNIRQSATMLGLDRSTLYEKLKRYGIKR